MSTTKRKRKSTKKTAPTAGEGNNVKVHYRGTLNDGTVFDSSYDRNETIEFTVGSGQMIPGFDAAVNGMTVGEKKTVNLEIDEAYGERIDEAVREVPKTSFPEDFEFETGVVVEGSINGNQVRGSIEEVSDESVIIDFNHPMAGQPLNFEIELVEIGE
tara:strand:+ start:10685 stop:11158 length:474 start_codon:yes stop_codon:yes gene_type:complete